MVSAKILVGVLLLNVFDFGVCNQIQPHDLWDDAQQFLVDYITAVTVALNRSEARFNELQEQIRAQSREAIEITNEAMKSVVDRIDEELQKLRDRANETAPGVIDRCISEYSYEIQRIPSRVTELISQCVKNLDDDILGQIDEARAKANGYLSHADELQKDIDSCRVASNSEECISRLVIEILLRTLEVPTNIDEIVRATSGVEYVYATEIPLCYRDRINSANNLADTIIRIIRNCAELS